MRYSFQRLSNYGALGNQLWQIAGTLGEAKLRGVLPAFPSDWFYRPYFEILDSYFVDDFSDTTDAGEQYFQDLSCWDHCLLDVFDMFEASDLVQELLRSTYGESLFGYTAVHVRRANNATPQYASHHPVPSLDYFEQAMALAGGPFRVFTDDTEWCQQQSIFKDCEFGQGPPKDIDVMRLTDAHPLGTIEAALDLHAISCSRKVIMSNSTFSWWGAWLRGPDSEHNDLTIYPARWFGEPLRHIDTTLMFNKNWTTEWMKLDVV